MKSVTRRRRESQQGYALLMIFLMAALIALMLYQQLPRVAFESEREKEQLLIDRGEQYTRAIQLYYLANNRTYPTSLDDLEKQERRFLRRRFVDPFTGKAEWRIIHTNGGFLTDSLVQKPPTDAQGQSASNSTNSSTSSASNSISSASNTNSTNNTTAANEPPQVNAAVLQRPSDRPVTPPGFGQTIGVQDPSSAQPVNTPLPPITLQPQQGTGALPPITLQPGGMNQPGGLPPITLAPIGAPGQQSPAQNPGLIPGRSSQQGQYTGQVPIPVQNPTGVAAPFPGQAPGGLPGGIPGVPPGFQIDANGQLVPSAPVPGQGGTPGQAQGIPGQAPGIPGQPQGIPGQPFTPQPPTASGPVHGSPSAALTAINNLLTTPRQTNTGPVSTSHQRQSGWCDCGHRQYTQGSQHKGLQGPTEVSDVGVRIQPNCEHHTRRGNSRRRRTLPNAQGQGGPGPSGGSNTFAPSGTFGPSGGQSNPGAGPGR